MTDHPVHMLIDQVEHVAYLRRVNAELQCQVKQARQEWEAQHQELLNAAGEAGSALALAELNLREGALFAYQDSGDKHPAPGVAIQVRTSLQYEEEQAVAWAALNCETQALSLNRREFERMAKGFAQAGHPLECVTFSEQPCATIATDLAKALGDN